MTRPDDEDRPFGEAANELEEAILRWSEGELDDDGFINAFLQSTVHLFGTELEEEDGMSLLLVQEEDEDWLPAFTCTDRARPMAEEAPEAQSLFAVDAAELIVHLGEEPPALVFNPGWEHSLAIPGELLASLRGQILAQLQDEPRGEG